MHSLSVPPTQGTINGGEATQAGVQSGIQAGLQVTFMGLCFFFRQLSLQAGIQAIKYMIIMGSRYHLNMNFQKILDDVK